MHGAFSAVSYEWVLCFEFFVPQGYAVVDDLFGAGVLESLRAEVLGLHKGSLMHANCTHLVKDNATKLLEKRQIHEAELTLDESIQVCMHAAVTFPATILQDESFSCGTYRSGRPFAPSLMLTGRWQ